MATLTKEQVKEILNKAPVGTNPKDIINGLIKRGYTLDGFPSQTSTPVTSDAPTIGSAGNTIVPGGIFGKNAWYNPGGAERASKVADFVGGKELATGLGMALKKDSVEKESAAQLKIKVDRMKAIESELAAAKRDGRENDIARLTDALRKEIQTSSGAEDTLLAFQREVPTTKEIIGSTLRLAATAASGNIAGTASKITGANKAIGFASGLGRGAASGAIAGATEGAIQGAGIGMEQNKDIGGIVGQSLLGAGIGGVTGGILGGIVGGVTGKMKATAQRREELVNLLKTKPDSRVAQYTMKGGQLVDDPAAQEAIKQGVDEGTVATIKGSSAADKAKASQALDILEKGRFDKTYRATNRPSDVLGDSAMQRFKPVYQANVKAAQELDTVAKSLQGKTVDPVPAVQSFIDDLDNMGIGFENGKPVFTGSDIEGLGEPQKIIERIVKRMDDVGDDAYELHRLKKFIDEQVDFGKTSGGLTGKTENVLKGLRHNIDEILDSSFDSYNRINTTYSETRNAIDELTSLGGSKFDPLAPNAQKKLGTLMRRILSNANSRVDVLNALNSLQEVATKYGGKFDDDIVTQAVFVDDLERLFGTSAPTSLAGETAKGFKTAGNVTSKLKSGKGLLNMALEGTGNMIERARGIDEEGLIRSLRELLKKSEGAIPPTSLTTPNIINNVSPTLVKVNEIKPTELREAIDVGIKAGKSIEEAVKNVTPDGLYDYIKNGGKIDPVQLIKRADGTFEIGADGIHRFEIFHFLGKKDIPSVIEGASRSIPK